MGSSTSVAAAISTVTAEGPVMRPTFVDASTFLGMHAIDDRLRRSCKAFFVAALARPLAMGFEEVARCDNVVWSQPRQIQDAYYPFMDNLHTDLQISRVALSEADVDVARADPRLAGLADAERFAVAMALRARGMLITINPALLAVADLPVLAPPAAAVDEPRFPDHLEALYRHSLALRLPVEKVMT